MAGRGKQEWAVQATTTSSASTTGAGDAFNAGFLDYLLASNGELSDQQVIEASLRLCGRRAVRHVGGRV